MIYPFSEEEYKKGIATLKNENETGIDDSLAELINNLGHWLSAMLNTCFNENIISKEWRQSKSIALLKFGKDSAILKTYRPVPLSCHTFNLY